MRDEKAGLGLKRVAVLAVALFAVSMLLAETASAGLAVVGQGRAVRNTPGGGINPWAIETDGSGDIVDVSGTGIPVGTEMIICAIGDLSGQYCSSPPGITYKPNSSATAISATAVPTPGAGGANKMSLWYITASQGALAGSYGAGGISWSATFSGNVICRTFQYVALTGLASTGAIDIVNDTNEMRATGSITLTELAANLPLGYNFVTGVVSNVGVTYPDPTLTTLTSRLAMAGNFLSTGTVVTSRFDITAPTAATGNRTVAYNAGAVGTAGWGVVIRPRYTVAVSASPVAGAVSVSGGGDFNAGDTVTLSASVTPAGSYTFVNWTELGSPVSNANPYTFAATADRTLVGNFTPNSYTVTFDAQGGTAPSPASISATYDSTYGTLATTSRPGYTFGGWWTGPGGTGTEVTSSTPVTLTGPQTLYAKWTANTYTVTFDAQGGSAPVPASMSVTFGSVYGALATSSLTGYTLSWWTGPGGTGTQITPATVVSIPSDHTLYANWTPNSYTVTFDAQGGDTPSPTSKSVTYAAAYGALATTSRTGYTLAGWWTGPAGTGSQIIPATVVSTASDHTLYANWTPNTYTLTFNEWGGSPASPPSKSVTFGTPYGTLATTSRAGYTFSGWWTLPNGGGSETTASTTVTTASDHAVYAKWIANTYTVTFDAQGGSAPSPATKTVTFDAPYGTLATTTRTGYAFLGWWTDPAAGTEITDTTTVAIVADQTLYAHWVAEFTVTFDPRGGVAPIPATKVVQYGLPYGTLPFTSRTGYSFNGWFTAITGGTHVLETDIVNLSADQTLYAQWTADTHTVTFDAQGGTTPVPPTKIVTYDSLYGTLATTTRAGYTFDGWFTAASGGTQVLETMTVSLMADQTLYAHWSANQYTVTFDAQGGTSPTPATLLVTFDASYGALATTSRIGYTFAGWFTASTGGTLVTAGTTVSTASNHTLYAHWTGINYTLTFDAQGGTAPVPASKSVTFGSAYGALATTTRVGYTFAGWFTASTGGTLVTSATVVSNPSDHTLFAQWTANQYTVTFDAQGGSAPSPATKSVTYDSTYGALATTTRAGYSFDGWWTASTGGTQVLDTTPVTITANQTLYAHWAANYTVTFDAQGGTIPSPASKVVTFGWQYGALATTTRTGYFFAGWWTAASGGVQVLDTTLVTTASDHTLYAHWSATSITVTFDAQGGSAPVPATKAVVFDSAYGALATTSRANYVFSGWWTATGGGTEVTSSTIVTNPSNHTLYAHWTPTYVVTFDGQGGSTPSPTSKVVTYGLTYGTLATTSRTGYTFGGWFTAVSGGGTEITSDTIVTISANQTLYAYWIANTYDVIFDAQGGDTPVPGFIMVIYDSPYGTLATTARAGYTFGGWWTGAGGTGTQITAATIVSLLADQTLYAKWTANTYTVDFDEQGGTPSVPASKTVTHNATYGALATTSRVGYTFNGWWTDPTAGVEVLSTSTVTVIADQTLYARWIPNVYTVTFDAQGGLPAVPATKDVTFGAPYGTLAATSRIGYYFSGWWTTPSGGTEVVSTSTVETASAHTLYAHWSIIAYIVTFDPQGGTTPVPPLKNVTYGSAYGDLATTTRSKYIFSGWWTAPVGGTQVLSSTLVSVAENHTLYAQWAHPLLVEVLPTSGNVPIGGAFTLTATANGGYGALHYAWKRNGAAAPYATDDRKYVISSAALTDAGTYRVDVTDEVGTLVSSNEVALTVGVGLPVAGVPALAALLTTLLTAGALAVRKKK